MKPHHILDFHAHFPAKTDVFDRQSHPMVKAYAMGLREHWREVFDFPEPEKENPGNEVQGDRWAVEVQNHQLEKIVFVTGGGNEVLADVVRRNPQEFLGFAHHDLCAPNAVEEMQHALDDLGLVGYKWFGPMTKLPFEAPELKPFWRLLADRKVPVLIHFGVLGGPGGVVRHPRISPITLAEVVQEYTDIPFIIPHFGAGYYQDLLHLAWSSPNVYIDSSGSNDWIRWMPYPLSLKDLFARALDTVGSKRIIFGTDSSWFPRGWARRYFELQTQVCTELSVTQAEMDAIFYGNGAGLLGLDMKNERD
ncbi:MAG: amidohydrolase family protein [Desulfitobacteriaceae bacterium]